MNRLLLMVGVAGAGFVGTVMLSGCFALHGPIDVKNNIARSNDVRIKQEFGISARGSTLRLARGLASSFVDEKLPRMAGIRRVQFGEYRIVGGDDNPNLLLHDLEIQGWEPVVRITQPGAGEEIRVFAREWNGKLKGILFVQREGDELRLARVKGNLDYALANIMEDLGDEMNIGDIPIFAKRTTEEDDTEEPTEVGASYFDVRDHVDVQVKQAINAAHAN